MAIRRRWKDLGPRTRRLILMGAAGEGLLKTAALIDLYRRPGEQVRGPKALWAVGIVLVNSAGALPVVYFLRGRRSATPHS